MNGKSLSGKDKSSPNLGSCNPQTEGNRVFRRSQTALICVSFSHSPLTISFSDGSEPEPFLSLQALIFELEFWTMAYWDNELL